MIPSHRAVISRAILVVGRRVRPRTSSNSSNIRLVQAANSTLSDERAFHSSCSPYCTCRTCLLPTGVAQSSHCSSDRTAQQQQQRLFSSNSKDDNNNPKVISAQDMQLAVDAVSEDQDNCTSSTILPGTTTSNSGRKLAIVFTCKVCNTRAAKQFTEQAYKHGVVLIRCPGCQNLHLIADRLGFFEDEGWDIEKALAKMGENFKAVNEDNVLELTLQDVLGEELSESIKQEEGGEQDENNDDKPR